MSIGGAGGPTGPAAQFVELMNNVKELETIHRKGETGRVDVSGVSGSVAKDSLATFRGRKVVSVKPRGNLLKRLVAFFSPTRRARELRAREREATALLHDQVLQALGDRQLDKQDRIRLVEDVANGIIPGFSRAERQEIRDRSLNTILRSESTGAMLIEAEQGIKAFPRLTNSIPAVSLYNARQAIKGYYTTLLLAPDRIPDTSRLHQDLAKLEQHFNDTRQSDGYQDLVNEVIQEIVHSFPERLSQDEYSQLLADWSGLPHTNRDKALARVADQTFANATRTELSIHGHPRELVLGKSYLFLQAMSRHPELTSRFNLLRVEQLKNQLNNDKAQVKEALDRLSAEVTELDVDSIRERLQAGEELTKEEGQLIAESRRVLLDIQLAAGRRWDLSMLSQPEHWNDQEDQLPKLLKIQEIGTLRGQEVDLAQLDWLIKQHDDARTHPRVAIEGAGPTGLTLALSQFEAGANVSIFEKRSTEYDRVQVVRLDPKWMDMLKFYLGEHYYELFGEGEEGKGIVRSDGFGEIVTHRLEEALHYRLTELISRNYDQISDSDEPPTLERMAAFELEAVEPGASGYKVRARYNPDSDVAKQARAKHDTFEEAVEHRPVDMIICAGGKNSRLRNKFMKDQVVTGGKPYGVCSWEGKKGEELPNQGLNTFQDFREMVVFNKDFHQHFKERLLEELPFLEASDKHTMDLAELERLTLDQGMQTRCFENKNLVYIGMELPEPFDQYCKKLEGEIKQRVLNSLNVLSDSVDTEKANRWAETKAKESLKDVHKAWFQAVAHYYGIDQSGSLGATLDKINDKFSSVFPLQQHRVEQSVVTEQTHGHDLTVTVAGDAAASPHFMSYSGLTGARENVLHLQNFTHQTANDTNPFAPALHQAALEGGQQRTADFVIQRGEVFLGSQLNN